VLQTSPRLNLTTDLGFMRLPRFRFLRSGLMLLAAACDHTSPFRPEPPAPAPPFSSFFPRRLSFNVGDDRTPAWLPDGSGILYSSERQDRPSYSASDTAGGSRFTSTRVARNSSSIVHAIKL
jgi:hypothetical protein